MPHNLQDFSVSPSARLQWRRALDELLIDAIFGAPHPMTIHPEHACPKSDDDFAPPPVLIAAE